MNTDKKHLYMGIDPGKTGGISFICNEYVLSYSMPKTERDIFDLFEEYSNKVIMCCLEKVASRPKQSSVATFTFGKGYGFLRGMLVANKVPFEDVSPQKWQKYLDCLTKGDKNITKAKAQQLFPDLKVTHSKADSLLIAEYCRRTKK